MTRYLTSAVFVVVLTAPGCGGGVAENVGGDDSAGELSTGVGADCSANGQSQGRASSQEEFRDRLLGRWLLCGTESVFAVAAGDVGLEITLDGHFYRLYPGATASPERGSGFDQEGTWRIIDTSLMNGPGSYQLNLELAGRGTIFTHPEFVTAPSKMRLNNNGVFVGTYVRE